MSHVRAGVDLARLHPLNERLQRDYLDAGRLPGCQWLLARHGEVVARHTLGRMDLQSGRALRDDTLYRIYSMTKPIASVALMMLYEEGRFGLNDPVQQWIPSWKDQRVWLGGAGAAAQWATPRTPMTVRHLLNHSSGLTYGGLLLPAGTEPDPVDRAYRELGINTRNGDSLETFVDKLGRVPLRFHPGEAWCYSFATDVVGYLVQRLSGLPFERFVHERILAPLGMHDTFFTVPAAKADRLATCYRYEAEDRRMVPADDPATSPWLKVPALHSGGGGLVSSLSDYHRFTEALRRGGELDGVRLLGPRTLALMRTNHLPGDADLPQRAVDSFNEPLQQGVGFGLGFATTLGGGRAGVPGTGDFYWSGLASTLFWVDPHEDLVVIVLTQLIPSRTYNLRGLFKSVVYGALVD